MSEHIHKRHNKNLMFYHIVCPIRYRKKVLTVAVERTLPEAVVKIIKSILAKEIFKIHPEIKKYLWGGSLWTSGYYINTVGQYANEQVMLNYIKNQGAHYSQIYRTQLSLFPGLE